VLDIADPMDMVQMTYRVAQIEQKYNRSLYGLLLVETYQAGGVTVPASQWVKQNKLRKKLAVTNQDTDRDTDSNVTITLQEREELFHMNTNKQFDIHHSHAAYQHLFQGPYRLIQVGHSTAQR
jgi:hypothetical protein